MTPASLRAENAALRSELSTLYKLRRMDQERVVYLEKLLVLNNIPLDRPDEFAFNERKSIGNRCLQGLRSSQVQVPAGGDPKTNPQDA